jgi:hypothetical protein
MSAICGGVLSVSMMKTGMKKHGAYYGMMSYTLPDKQYKKWCEFEKQGKKKEADKIFERYACSNC